MLLALCFVPIVGSAFVAGVLGDCAVDVPAEVCSASKDQAVTRNLLVALVAYVVILAIRTARSRERHAADQPPLWP